jgi:hypothetical protein
VETQYRGTVTLETLNYSTFAWRGQEFRVGHGAYVWTTPLERTTNHLPLCTCVVRIEGFWVEPDSGRLWAEGRKMYHHREPQFVETLLKGLLGREWNGQGAPATAATAKSSRGGRSHEWESDDVSEDDQVWAKAEDDDDSQEGSDGDGDYVDEAKAKEEGDDSKAMLLFHMNELFDSKEVEFHPLELLYEPCRIQFIHIPLQDDEPEDEDDDEDEGDSDEDDEDGDDEYDSDSGEGSWRKRKRRRSGTRSRKVGASGPQRQTRQEKRQSKRNNRFRRERFAVCERIDAELASSTVDGDSVSTFYCAEQFERRKAALERLSADRVQSYLHRARIAKVERAEDEEKKMAALDLFSGCGGMSIGLEMAGIDVKWAVGTCALTRCLAMT